MTAHDFSYEQLIAELPPEDQRLLLESVDLEELFHDWRFIGRPSQLFPVMPEEGGNSWSKALALAGRGWGKTLSGNEWIREVDANWGRLGRAPGQRLRVALLGRTISDVRDTLVQGQSGILNIYPPSMRDQLKYTPSRRRVDLPGGGIITCFSADKPDQLRGPEFHIGVADEIAAHKQIRGDNELTALENMEFAVRLGNAPQIAMMTTPKKVPVLKRLLKEAANNPKFLLRRGRTLDNVHLDVNWVQSLLDKYEGTDKGKQELDGELLDLVKGAMASEDKIESTRVSKLPLGSYFRFIGLDPSVSEEQRDEAGIVVVYVSKVLPITSRHAYVMEDLSDNMTPDEWAEATVLAADRHQATIITEVNQGGSLVKNSLFQVAKDMGLERPPVKETWSSKAKAVRATPVSVALNRGRIHMVGTHELLEDELTTWVPEDRYSPNRLDALVFATVAAMFEEALTSGSPGKTTSHSVVGRRIGGISTGGSGGHIVLPFARRRIG